jgi:flagellum-specific ATP synthase
MVARNSEADVTVIALGRERGREVREFLENDLGPEGSARSVSSCHLRRAGARCACARR